ncbi:MAG: Flp family type IVb pilin [Asticcacaulis sp.]
MNMLKAFLKDENGATAIEYGLIAAMIFLVCVTSIYAFGDRRDGLYTRLGDEITNAMEK